MTILEVEDQPVESAFQQRLRHSRREREAMTGSFRPVLGRSIFAYDISCRGTTTPGNVGRPRSTVWPDCQESSLRSFSALACSGALTCLQAPRACSCSRLTIVWIREAARVDGLRSTGLAGASAMAEDALQRSR